MDGSRCALQYTWRVAYDILERLESVSLLIAIRTKSEVILATDGLSLQTDMHTGADVPFPSKKLHTIAGTSWVMVSVGHGIFDTFSKELEAEVELGQRPAFDVHLEIGGPAYLRSLRDKAREANPYGDIPQCWVVIAGFDRDNNPLILSANPPLPGYSIAEPITTLGAQWPTAAWILHLLAGSCTTVDALQKLACFTIWQISKQELKIGSIEAGYPIYSCILKVGESPHFEEMSRAALDGWLTNWEEELQTCFMEAILSIPKL